MGSFLLPDSPTNAWFLTEDERAKAVRRIKVCDHSSTYALGLTLNKENQTGVENKHFKKEQSVPSIPLVGSLLLICVQDD